ncbi:unnamed protein product [Linum trigynum]|uniref:Uncharacterized protein n=1 Tax=Linum trigynum TaxID=586398 RepID=A0AAV2C6E7_9ROSI
MIKSSSSATLMIVVVVAVAVLCFMSTLSEAKGGRSSGGRSSSRPVVRGAVVGGALSRTSNRNGTSEWSSAIGASGHYFGGPNQLVGTLVVSFLLYAMQ